MQGQGLCPPHIDQFFGVLGLLREVDEDDAAAGEVALAEVGDIPAGFGGQHPAASEEDAAGLGERLVDGGPFNGPDAEGRVDSCQSPIHICR